MEEKSIQLFENKQIRTKWDEETEKWYFSIVDVVAVLTDSIDYQTARKYWKVLKGRLLQEGDELVTNCYQLKLRAADGKMRLTDVADQVQLFRLIQSIPSPKAEPIKQWIARVASERIDEIQDPEMAIERGYEYYRRKGYSEEWIKQRQQGISTRKGLTDEWQRCGVKDIQYATLTDILTKEWSGFTTREYKAYKGLKKENLRDHMTNLETAVNTLAEAVTTELSKKNNPKTFDENRRVAKAGGSVAKKTRIDIERRLGKSIVSNANAKQLQHKDDETKEIP
ncbi:MAG: Bro-N domain-containing protein [Candidatus Cryptobacteroides sp.]|nr:Bro-N domain-containing protein [Bacteroidales bacterium]MDD7133065.1 Bro-N domain-containing protein [Bacteroidales bacterium]MDY2773048.1 Bro-N domain-containing protein [Candidatus Cryptobacteroides sp.]